MKPCLVFDMDGVLVDVTESYRETICQTVEHFTGRPLGAATVQEYKNRGGANDDWRLSQRIIVERGVEVALEDVVAYFQSIFRGENGLILRERWLAKTGLLERLSQAYRLAVFTGRPCEEARFTLDRFAPKLSFAPLVAMEHVKQPKPHPEGLLQINGAAWYVGDTVDDARCAKAASVPFIGIAAPANPRYGELVQALRGENATAVLDDINGLEAVLPL